MLVRFIQNALGNSGSLFCMLYTISLCEFTHNLFVNSSINGHLGWFQFFTIMNSAVIKVLVHVIWYT